MVADPQTFTQSLAPWLPLITPAALLGAAFWLGKFINSAKTELNDAKESLDKMMTNCLPTMQKSLDTLVELAKHNDARMDAWLTSKAAQHDKDS